MKTLEHVNEPVGPGSPRECPGRKPKGVRGPTCPVFQAPDLQQPRENGFDGTRPTMSHLNIVPPSAVQSNTLDLFTHPLAADGLRLRYRMAGHYDPGAEEPCPSACLEILADRDTMAAFAVEVEAAAEAAGLSGPRCEPASDYGGGTWRAADVVGPRGMILELALVAQRLGCERRPWRN